jgi:hypothetical protein
MEPPGISTQWSGPKSCSVRYVRRLLLFLLLLMLFSVVSVFSLEVLEKDVEGLGLGVGLEQLPPFVRWGYNGRSHKPTADNTQLFTNKRILPSAQRSLKTTKSNGFQRKVMVCSRIQTIGFPGHLLPRKTVDVNAVAGSDRNRPKFWSFKND